MKKPGKRGQAGFALLILSLVVTVGAGLYALGTNAMQHKARLDEAFSKCEQVMENDTGEVGNDDPFSEYRNEYRKAIREVGSQGAQVALDAIMTPIEGADIGMNAVQALDSAFSDHQDLDSALQAVEDEAQTSQQQPQDTATSQEPGAGEASAEVPHFDGKGLVTIAGGQAEISATCEHGLVYASLRITDETLQETHYNEWQDFFYPVWFLDNQGEGKFFGKSGTVSVEAACSGPGVAHGERRKIGYLGVVSGAVGTYSWDASADWEVSGPPGAVYQVSFFVKGKLVGIVSCK